MAPSFVSLFGPEASIRRALSRRIAGGVAVAALSLATGSSLSMARPASPSAAIPAPQVVALAPSAEDGDVEEVSLAARLVDEGNLFGGEGASAPLVSAMIPIRDEEGPLSGDSDAGSPVSDALRRDVRVSSDGADDAMANRTFPVASHEHYSQEAVDSNSQYGLIEQVEGYYGAHEGSYGGKLVASIKVGETIEVDGMSVVIEGYKTYPMEMPAWQVIDELGWDKAYFTTCQGTDEYVVYYGSTTREFDRSTERREAYGTDDVSVIEDMTPAHEFSLPVDNGDGTESSVATYDMTWDELIEEVPELLEEVPELRRVWVEEQGHYEEVTHSEWVVVDTVWVVTTPEHDECYDEMAGFECDDGTTFTMERDAMAYAEEAGCGYHQIWVHREYHVPEEGYWKDVYELQTTSAGQKWVVDVPGHYEDR